MTQQESLCIDNVVWMNNKNWIFFEYRTFFATLQAGLIKLDQHVVLQHANNSKDNISQITPK